MNYIGVSIVSLIFNFSKFLFIMTPTNASIQTLKPEDLYGTWKLNSFIQTQQSNGAKTYPMGQNPNGTITFTPDNRIVVLITTSNRPNPTDLTNVSQQDQLALYNSMMAYGGTYKLTGDNKGEFIIDIAWNQTWVGETQPKTFTLDGNRLSIIVGPMIGIAGYEIVATLNWTKID